MARNGKRTRTPQVAAWKQFPPPDVHPTAGDRAYVNGFVVAIAALGLLFAGSWYIGKDFRVVYLGRDTTTHTDGIVVKTEPAMQAVIPPSIDLTTLKPGCRYDFNYAPALDAPRRRGGDPYYYRDRVVRAVTLVDCPPG